jgi:hypothetical protein
MRIALKAEKALEELLAFRGKQFWTCFGGSLP